MSIKIKDIANWLANELDGNGFQRIDRRTGYHVVDEAWTEDGAVVLRFGNEKIRLTITRED